MNHVALDRPEATRSFENALRNRVTIVAAPAGYGKTELARRLVTATGATIRMRPERAFERFLGDALQAVGPEAPGRYRSLASVYAKASVRADGPRTLADWFCRHLGDADRTIVVDGLDTLDERLQIFLSAAIAATTTTRWVLVGRDPGVVRAYAGDAVRADVGSEDLRLSFPELRALARQIAPDQATGDLFGVARKADGSISRAVFILHCIHYGVAGATDPGVSFDALVDRCLLDLSERERLETMAALLLEDGGDAGSSDLTAHVSAVFSRLRTTAPFLFEPGGRRLQSALRDRLAGETRTLIETNRHDLFVRAGDALEAGGHTSSAIALFCAAGALDRLLAVVERRGALGLEGEEVHVLREAIALIPSEVSETHALVVGLRAVDASNRGHVVEAQALFERALARCEPGDLEQSIRYWYASLGIRRGDPVLVARMLRPSVEFFRSPPPLRAAMMALLGVAWAMRAEPSRAQAWSARSRIISDAHGDDALAARVYQQSAYVALAAADLDGAESFAQRAIGHAEACGWSHVAAISYGVLHSVAVTRDLDDARAHAIALADHAGRAGNVTLAYQALAACLEHETDRCDLPAIARLRADLARFDPGPGSVVTSDHPERPARAMQFAWEGRFAQAYHELEPLLAADDAAPERTVAADAQAFSAAALYAAASGLRTEARRALRASRRAAAREPQAPLERTRIYEALALFLLGNRRESDLAMRAVYASLPPSRTRSRVFADLAASVIESTESPTGAVATPLETELHAIGWGGPARLARSILASARIPGDAARRSTQAFG